MVVDCIIPARDEALALPGVLVRLMGPLVRRVVVVDNGSRDGTGEVALAHGAEVVREGRRGYGAACLAGLAHLAADPPEVVVFLAGDQADDPRDLPSLLAPFVEPRVQLVLGSRTLGDSAGRVEAGSLTPEQRLGNALAATMIRLLYHHPTTDLGPFRAIRWPALLQLGMRDRDYGWTAEMQVRALRRGLLTVEVPVSYHRRAAGRSKVSGTLRGTAGAGWKIITTILRHAIVP